MAISALVASGRTTELLANTGLLVRSHENSHHCPRVRAWTTSGLLEERPRLGVLGEVKPWKRSDVPALEHKPNLIDIEELERSKSQS